MRNYERLGVPSFREDPFHEKLFKTMEEVKTLVEEVKDLRAKIKRLEEVVMSRERLWR